MKKAVPSFLKPILAYARVQGYTGNYRSWREAKRSSNGYDAPLLVDVARGGGYELAHGISSPSVYRSWPVLFGLLKSSADSNSSCVCLDLGGALGTVYHRDRHFLPPLRWCVVEQEQIVKVGREEFQTDELQFYYSIRECAEREQINTVLLSGVLQYIESPHDTIDEIVKLGASYIIIDRTPFVKQNHDRLTVQRVFSPRSSYPAWFFNEAAFLQHFNGYSILAEWNSPDKANIKSTYKGFLLKRWSRNINT